MAIVERSLHKEIYQSLKGVIDFYYYKGLLCARMYPQHCRQPGTDLQKKTWTALKESSKNRHLITKHDMEGFRNLAGGSHLTWYDLYKKVFMKGWHCDQKVPAILHDTSAVITEDGRIKFCFRCTEDTEVQICRAQRNLQVHHPWSWLWKNPDTTPPNCHGRVELCEYWEYVNTERYRGGGSLMCYDLGDAPSYGGSWITAFISGGVYEDTMWRTGCWWVAL